MRCADDELCRETDRVSDYLLAGFRHARVGIGKLVAGVAKIFVPSFGEAGDEVFDGASGDFEAGPHDFAPSMDARAVAILAFESDPLADDDAHGVVNPADFFRGDALSDDVVDDGVDGAEDFNFHATAGFPGSAFAPAQLAVDIGELIPAVPISENIPGDVLAGAGGYRVLKMDHDSKPLLMRFPN